MSNKPAIVPRNILFPFLLLSTCFAMWGLSNNMTDPLVKAFKGIFTDLSTFQLSLIQNAFYGAYFCLAIPGAIIARKFGYKKGILFGLGMYIVGGLLFLPASNMKEYAPFLFAFFVLAGGLSILETSANPYIIAMGPEKTATQRLNIAQSFNPVGSLIGLFVCKFAILKKLEAVKVPEGVDAAARDAIQSEQLSIVMTPYLIAALVLIILWVLIAINKNMPSETEHDSQTHFSVTIKQLLNTPNYIFAVIAQFFYVGAQITVWTYTLHYITGQLGIEDSQAMNYHMGAIISFALSRWIFSALMLRFKPSSLLLIASITGLGLCFSVIFVGGIVGVYSLVAVSACMSLMFPTIFGLGSRGLGEATKLGASGLIMAILGGALITMGQGGLIDFFLDGAKSEGMALGAAAAKSYALPAICFVVIAAYAFYCKKNKIEDRMAT
jgi:FHS family L-fucose permease-like MFS transporter